MDPKKLQETSAKMRAYLSREDAQIDIKKIEEGNYVCTADGECGEVMDVGENGVDVALDGAKDASHDEYFEAGEIKKVYRTRAELTNSRFLISSDAVNLLRRFFCNLPADQKECNTPSK